MMHVLLELRDGLSAEGMRNSFAFAGMSGPITCIEETRPDGDKGIVVLAGGEFG